MKSKGRVSTWTTSANCEDDEARMANNPKGEFELQGFKALGFKLVYSSSSSIYWHSNLVSSAD